MWKFSEVNNEKAQIYFLCGVGGYDDIIGGGLQ